MWGYPNNSYELQNTCTANGLHLLEDLSHCHGTKLSDGEKIGNIGDISIFSTHERKMITTGEGGFLLTNNKGFHDKLIRLRSFGTGASHEYGKDFGLNYRMSGINAALGMTQLKKLNQKIKQRSEHAHYLLNHLNLPDNVIEVDSCGGASNYYALALIFKNNINQAKKIAQYLYKHRIISDTYAYQYKPLYKMPLLKRYKNQCPVAEIMTNSIITLPTHEGLDSKDLNHIIKTFNNYKI